MLWSMPEKLFITCDFPVPPLPERNYEITAALTYFLLINLLNDLLTTCGQR